MSSFSERRNMLSVEARRTLDELITQRADEVLDLAGRRSRGTIEPIDILRAYYDSSPVGAESSTALPVEVEHRIAYTERRLTSLFLVSFSMLLVPTVITAIVGLLAFAQDSGGVAAWSGWVPLIAGLLGAVLLVVAFVSVVMFLSQRAARRNAEMFDRFARDVSLQSSVRYERLKYASDSENVDIIAESEEAAINRYTFMAQWLEVEKHLRQLAEIALDGDTAERPISSVVQSLVHDEIISGDTEFRIKRLLITRNEVAHREHPRMDWGRITRDVRDVESDLAQALDAARRHGWSSL